MFAYCLQMRQYILRNVIIFLLCELNVEFQLYSIFSKQIEIIRSKHITNTKFSSYLLISKQDRKI